MKHLTKYTIWKIDQARPEPDTTYKVSEIEQPAIDRIRAIIVGKLDRLTYTVPGLKQVWRFGEVNLDKITQRLHERKCDDDCMTGRVWRRTDDRNDPGSIETYCGRLPLGASYDCWIYDIVHRNQKTLNTYTLDTPA